MTGKAATPEPERLLEILLHCKTVAVVGASDDPAKQANQVPAYLLEHGFTVIPVNPGVRSVLGLPSSPTLADIVEPVDVVQVFRPASEAPEIARAAAAIGARILWMQLGIRSEEAAHIASAAGMEVVMNACMRSVHRKLLREQGREPHPGDDGR